MPVSSSNNPTMNPRSENSSNQNLAPGSFRDRSGFVFFRDGQIFRQINREYAGTYEKLVNSGLYRELVKRNMLVEHEEAAATQALSDDAYKIITPRLMPFISYPYEWCFSQYKDAALLTIEIQKYAFEYGMVLKDASAYNIQFVDNKPILIDTLSFEIYEEGESWVAYRQFCQHFLAPLALMSYKDVRLGQLMRVYIDGLPLDLVSDMLPFRTRTNFALFSHIHLHSKAQSKYADKELGAGKKKISKIGFSSIVDNLQSAVRSLSWKPEKSTWSQYSDEMNYTEQGFKHKQEIVSNFLDEIKGAKYLWDFGANVGEFSRIASRKGLQTVSFDYDTSVVEGNYLKAKREDERNLLPLICDLTNPSPDIGWDNEERTSLFKRGPADIILALALIHHLAISNNVPMSMLAKFFSSHCGYLIIEFIPKSDSKVKRLLSSREDIFRDYSRENFENEFKKFFSVADKVNVQDSERSIYLMRKEKDGTNHL